MTEADATGYPKVELHGLSEELDDEWTDIFLKGAIGGVPTGGGLLAIGYLFEIVPLSIIGFACLVLAVVLGFLAVPAVLNRSVLGVVDYSIENSEDEGALLCLRMTPRKDAHIEAVTAEVTLTCREYKREFLGEDRRDVTFKDTVWHRSEELLASDVHATAGTPLEIRGSLGIEPGSPSSSSGHRDGDTAFSWAADVQIRIDDALDWRRDLTLKVS